MIVAPYIEINQPIGSFYFSKMKATDLGQLVHVTPRSASPSAIQRDESSQRINEIAKYCSDPDATFPTPIIISIYEDANITLNNNNFEIPLNNNKKIGEVIIVVKQDFQIWSLWYVNNSTVKLGNKERFDKEQIGIKEPFTS